MSHLDDNEMEFHHRAQPPSSGLGAKSELDIPQVEEIRQRALGKYNPLEWSKATMAEMWLAGGQGEEWITGVGGEALVKQSGALESTGPVQVLDIGCGMGQVTQTIVDDKGKNEMPESLSITAGDVDDSFLEVMRIKKEAKGWNQVKVEKLDVMKLDLQDNTFTHVFGNYLYFLVRDPIAALKESIRVLKPGGTLGFTTWAYTGAFYLLTHAQTLIPEAPDSRSPTIPSPSSVPRAWHHRGYLRHLLSEELGLEDVQISLCDYRHDTAGPRDTAKGLWPVIPVFTMKWGDKRGQLGWELFEAVEKIVETQSEDQGAKFSTRYVSLVVTAKKPVGRP